MAMFYQVLLDVKYKILMMERLYDINKEVIQHSCVGATSSPSYSNYALIFFSFKKIGKRIAETIMIYSNPFQQACNCYYQLFFFSEDYVTSTLKNDK